MSRFQVRNYTVICQIAAKHIGSTILSQLHSIFLESENLFAILHISVNTALSGWNSVHVLSVIEKRRFLLRPMRSVMNTETRTSHSPHSTLKRSIPLIEDADYVLSVDIQISI